MQMRNGEYNIILYVYYVCVKNKLTDHQTEI